MIQSFTFDMPSVTISCTDFVKFSLISLNLLSIPHLISLTEDSQPCISCMSKSCIYRFPPGNQVMWLPSLLIIQTKK